MNKIVFFFILLICICIPILVECMKNDQRVSNKKTGITKILNTPPIKWLKKEDKNPSNKPRRKHKSASMFRTLLSKKKRGNVQEKMNKSVVQLIREKRKKKRRDDEFKGKKDVIHGSPDLHSSNTNKKQTINSKTKRHSSKKLKDSQHHL